MTKLLQFVSMAMLTQITLALTQVVLLPIQIRFWGHGTIAAWYSALAVAALTSIFDCGLRTAAHTDLLRLMQDRGDAVARERVRQVWGWIRTLVASLTLLLIVIKCVSAPLFEHQPYPIWKAVLVLAYSVETLLSVRIVYLDSLGFYRQAEAGYFAMVAVRLFLSIPALLVWHVNVSGLA